MQLSNPGTIAPPLSNYSHAALVPEGYRWLHVSGQVGVGPDGTIVEGAQAQLERSWANLFAILDAEGFAAEDIVKVNTFLLPQVDVALSRRVRDKWLGGRAPASTLLVVAALANPAFLVEVELIAARKP